MRAQRFALAGVLLLGSAAPAWADRCTQVTEVVGGIGGTYADLSDRPSRVCSVQFIASADLGSAQVYDSPDDLETHAQTQNISEPGQEKSGQWASGWFGDDGIRTRHGLDVLVKSGRLIVKWGDGL